MLYTFFFFLCHLYVIVCHLFVIRISFVFDSYVICMSLVWHKYVTRIYSYVFLMYSYVTSLYSYVIVMSLVCTRMSCECTPMPIVCHLHVLVCHTYVTRIYSYVMSMSLVFGFTMNHKNLSEVTWRYQTNSPCCYILLWTSCFLQVINKNVLKWFLLIMCKEHTLRRSKNPLSRSHPALCFWLRREGRQMSNTY